MKIGLFFGSYNPIHVGHVMIANYMKNFTDLDEVWLVVSPHNPLKPTDSLLNAYDRLEMVHLGVEDGNGLRAMDIEFNLPKPSYTIDTLVYLADKYPEKEFVLIMGADNLTTLHKWKNYQKILEYYQIYVYPRFGAEIPSQYYNHSSIIVTETPRIEISSNFLRTAIQEGKSVSGFVPYKVLDFIQKKGLYRK